MRALILALMCSSLWAIEQQGDKVVLSDDDRKTLANCQVEGGVQGVEPSGDCNAADFVQAAAARYGRRVSTQLYLGASHESEPPCVS